jgi:hypothetical protein
MSPKRLYARATMALRWVRGRPGKMSIFGLDVEEGVGFILFLKHRQIQRDLLQLFFKTQTNSK